MRLFTHGRVTVLIPTIAGAAGCVAFTLFAGRHNKSVVLAGLFAIWVLSPFVGLLMTEYLSKRWSNRARATLAAITPLLTLASLAIYAVVAFGPPRPKTAATFLMVPLVSWLLIAAALATALFMDRRSRLNS